MMRIKLIIEYDGTGYCGWQAQDNGKSIQETVEQAIFETTGERLRVTGSGRTDSGVHALGQVAHFDTDTTIPADKIAFALNAHLPEDIRIRSSERAEEGFHARKSAKIKHYRYLIYNDTQECAIMRRYCAFVRRRLNVDAMNAAARYIVGKHDFAAFCAKGSTPVATTVREVYECAVMRDGKYVAIDVKGGGFLYNMVRIIAGTLIDVGTGRIPPERVKEIIQSEDRNNASATAPAKGLTMVGVSYVGETSNTKNVKMY